jgi:hypothetical protein
MVCVIAMFQIPKGKISISSLTSLSHKKSLLREKISHCRSVLLATDTKKDDNLSSVLHFADLVQFLDFFYRERNFHAMKAIFKANKYEYRARSRKKNYFLRVAFKLEIYGL